MAQRNRAEMMKLIRDVKKQGLEVTRAKSGHWQVTGPTGKTTHLSFSPGAKGIQQSMKQLRAVGYDDSPRTKGSKKAATG